MTPCCLEVRRWPARCIAVTSCVSINACTCLICNTKFTLQYQKPTMQAQAYSSKLIHSINNSLTSLPCLAICRCGLFNGESLTNLRLPN